MQSLLERGKKNILTLIYYFFLKLFTFLQIVILTITDMPHDEINIVYKSCTYLICIIFCCMHVCIAWLSILCDARHEKLSYVPHSFLATVACPEALWHRFLSFSEVS